ncbi:MAG: hypothetical protein MZV63_40290 [Marinilabiliales bacterium]|nr:hypothetical protein [Marinilabiliales bacterium]
MDDLCVAGFGGILLTFLAGAEIDTRLLEEKSKESFLIGIFSFALPFLGIFLYTRFVARLEPQGGPDRRARRCPRPRSPSSTRCSSRPGWPRPRSAN